MNAQIKGSVTNQGQECDAIDAEWIELLLEAKIMGLTVNEVREFVHSAVHTTVTVSK